MKPLQASGRNIDHRPLSSGKAACSRASTWPFQDFSSRSCRGCASESSRLCLLVTSWPGSRFSADMATSLMIASTSFATPCLECGQHSGIGGRVSSRRQAQEDKICTQTCFTVGSQYHWAVQTGCRTEEPNRDRCCCSGAHQNMDAIAMQSDLKLHRQLITAPTA